MIVVQSKRTTSKKKKKTLFVLKMTIKGDGG